MRLEINLSDRKKEFGIRASRCAIYINLYLFQIVLANNKKMVQWRRRKNNLRKNARSKKQSLIKENGKFCGYCKKKCKKLTIDHIVPISKGGLSNRNNLMLACSECNTAKANKEIAQ